MRDTKAVAMEAGEFLKSKNPNVEVAFRDLVGVSGLIRTAMQAAN